jgi:DNA-binding MarR family transcriptional regulator
MTSYHPTNEDLPNGRTADTSKGVVADLATAVGAQLPSASVPISFPAKVDVLCQWFAQVLRDRDAKDPVALVYAKAVAGVLCWLHANRERGRCDPSLETIAKEAGIGKQSAKDATDLLEARGHVRIIRGGDRRSSKYVLLMQRGNGLHSEDRSSVALTSTERSRKRRAMQRERSSCNGETVFVQRGNGLHSGDSNPKTLNPKNLEPEEARTSSALLAGQENEGKGKSNTTLADFFA